MNWIKNREPAATAALVLAVIAAAGPAVADLPADASWGMVAGAFALAVVRFFVTPAGEES